MKYIPDKGDIIWLQFNPQAGSEQAGHRPCLVISSKIYNQFGLAVVCPITSKTKGYHWEVPLTDANQTQGNILSDQVKNLDWRVRKAKFIEAVFPEVLSQVLERINILLFSK